MNDELRDLEHRDIPPLCSAVEHRDRMRAYESFRAALGNYHRALPFLMRPFINSFLITFGFLRTAYALGRRVAELEMHTHDCYVAALRETVALVQEGRMPRAAVPIGTALPVQETESNAVPRGLAWRCHNCGALVMGPPGEPADVVEASALAAAAQASDGPPSLCDGCIEHRADMSPARKEVAPK